MTQGELPIPAHFDPEKVAEIWQVPYQDRAAEARAWQVRHSLQPAADDALRIGLLIVDAQNTFCLPGYELFVAGRSGTGAVDDNRRLCRFIYRNLHRLTQILLTLDTHQPIQIFHPVFLMDSQGRHPKPFTEVSYEAVRSGHWQVNPAACAAAGLDPDQGHRYLLHYTRKLAEGNKYSLTIWPYHALLGGPGHALVSSVEEVVFFHSLARHSRPEFQIKGNHPLTEHYSALGPEVTEGPDGEELVGRNTRLIETLLDFDRIVIAGQARSHCVAWTIEDLLLDPVVIKRGFGRRVYLLEDCTSPVVVPGALDFTDRAREAFRRFADRGVHIVRSETPMEAWDGFFEPPRPPR